MIYYIADPHFGHKGIIDRCDRPFDDVVAMNDHMIAFWNRRVKKSDTVYILGDMFHHCEPETVKSTLKCLKGNKHLVVGNHDVSWLSKINAGKYFESVSNMIEINDANRTCVLCHYPLLTWRREDKAYMIYGHIHDKTSADFWPLLVGQDRMLNAGVEVNHYAPVTLDGLIANNRLFKEVHRFDKKVLEYRGYKGSVEVSLAERHLYGTVLEIEDMVTYDAETVRDLKKEFCRAVDGYIDYIADKSAWEDAEIEAVLEMQKKKKKNFFEEATI